MASICHQKRKAKQDIAKLMEEYLRQYPERATGTAIGLTRCIAATMTLKELLAWQAKIENILDVDPELLNFRK